MTDDIPTPWNAFDNFGIQAAQYNIESFFWGVDRDFRNAFIKGPLRVGERAPSFCLPTIAGDEFNLDIARADRFVALIFGSGGAGPCVREMPAIEQVYRRYAGSACTVVFVYTREVHPNEAIPPTNKILAPHRSMEQKIEQARSFADEVGLTMPVCVDDLIGTADRAYGCLPFTQAIVDRSGVLVQRSDWADPDLLEVMFRNILRGEERAREGRPVHQRSIGYNESYWYR